MKGPFHIIGAGIAGASVAYAFARRHIAVTVWEKGKHPGTSASGNPSGIFRPVVKNSLLGDLVNQAFDFSLDLFKEINFPWHACGVFERLIKPPSALKKARGQYVDAQEASERVHWPLSCGGWWFEKAGWLEPQKLCTALLTYPEIQCHFKAEITSPPQGTVIWATGVDTPYTSPCSGQISLLHWSPLSALKAVICGGGYVIPNGLIGATFHRGLRTLKMTLEDHLENIAKMRSLLELPEDFSGQILGGRCATRAMTSDHLPILGGEENTYWIGGLGSRGLVLAPFLGEILVRYILGEPVCILPSLQTALSFQRFKS